MALGFVYPVRSISTVHFTGSLAQNAGLAEDLQLPGYIGPSGSCRVKSVSIWSQQNLDWEIWLFANNYLGGVGGALPAITGNYDLTGAAAGLGTPAAPAPFNEGQPGTGITLCGIWRFTSANGKQIGGAGPFFYYIDGNDIPYWDEQAGLSTGPRGTQIPRLHTVLVNRNASSKNSGATGALVLQVNVELPQGF